MTKLSWKYLMIILMAGLLAFGIAACGGSEDKPVAGYPADGEGSSEEAGGFNSDGIPGDVGGSTGGESLGEPGEGVTDGDTPATDGGNSEGSGSAESGGSSEGGGSSGSTGGDLETAPGAVVTTEARPTEDPEKGAVMDDLETVGGGLTWHRQGGIAGFCDIVTILAGTATVTNCGAEPPEIVKEISLTLEQSQQMNTWLEELAPFEHSEDDGAVADSMTIVLTFFGKGDDEPSQDDLDMMEALAIDVLQDETSRTP